jgi:hypothetical protein
VELCQYQSPFVNRPTFVGDYVAIADSLGRIFIFDPETHDSDIVEVPNSQVIVWLAGTSSEHSFCGGLAGRGLDSC